MMLNFLKFFFLIYDEAALPGECYMMVRRKAQSSVEYLFMIAVALVVVFLVIAHFLSPRAGTINRVGSMESSIEGNIGSELHDLMSSS